MLREKPKLFTIGQFAALHGINKKTLMWYDEIGLFKPAFIHEENGYRLYSYYQSTELEVILLLRHRHFQISNILPNHLILIHTFSINPKARTPLRRISMPFFPWPVTKPIFPPGSVW